MPALRKAQGEQTAGASLVKRKVKEEQQTHAHLLNMFRRTAIWHVWGKQPENQAAVQAREDLLMQEWMKGNPESSTAKINAQRLAMNCAARQQLFEELSPAEQAAAQELALKLEPKSAEDQ